MELEMETNNSCLFLLLLPVEIVADIFSRLPIDSVLQCKLVCRTWRDFLVVVADHHHDNPIVEKAAAGGFLLRKDYGGGGFHYGEYYNDDDKVVPCFNLTRKTIIHHEYPFQDSRKWAIVGSCNGLICLCRNWQALCIISSCEPGTYHYDDMYVCNPYTGEYAKLPNPSYPRIDQYPHSINRAYGFGYHPITNEYKVITIYYITSRFEPFNSVHVQVYTLGSDTAAWRSIGKIEHILYRSRYTVWATWGNQCNNNWGILLNGVLYWLTDSGRIISFDMADEEYFRDISTTPELHGYGVLGVLNGCLCFSTGRCDNTRIWVMNNNDYSWSQKFSISWECQRGFNKYYYPLARLESGKILLRCNYNTFAFYDPETKHIVELKMKDDLFDIIPYMKSSVSLKALGEKEAIHVKAL